MINANGPRPERKKLRSLAAISALALAASMNVAAQIETAVPLTLAEAERLALLAEPGQQAMRAGAAALTARAQLAAELPDPSLRIALNNYPLGSGDFSTEAMTSAGVMVRQAFAAGQSRDLGARQLNLLAGEMNANAETRHRTVLMAARIAWLDVYQWQQVHDLVFASQPYFDDLVTISRSLYALGRKGQQDVLRAELEQSRLVDRLIDIERRRSQASAALGEWIGTDSNRPVASQLPGSSSLPALEVLRSALADHPILRAADAQLGARDTGVELARQRAKPGWALELGYNYRDGYQPSGEPRADMVSLGVSVDLPFFRKRSVDATLAAALGERSAAEMRREQLRRELDSQLVAEFARWQDSTRRLELYENRILDQASSNAEVSMLAYQSDQGNFADVMRAYIDDLNTRIDHIRLQVERAQSHAVLANLGGLQE